MMPRLYNKFLSKDVDPDNPEVMHGKLAGYCPNCDLMLMDTDLKKTKYKCPACGRYVDPIEERAEKNEE